MTGVHPILFHAGPLLIPAYGVVMAIALVACLGLAQRCARRAGMEPGHIWNAGIIALFCGAIAAKGWMVMTHFAAFRRAPALILNLSAVGGGEQGRVAAVTAALVFSAYVVHAGLSLRSALDVVAAPVLLLLAAEGLACWFAGCGFGTPAAGGWTSTFHSPYAFVWWGTPMAQPLHATQLISLAVFATLAVLAIVAAPRLRIPGTTAGWSVLLGSLAAFLLQFWRGDVLPLSTLHVTATQLACLLCMAAAGALLYQRNPA